MATVNEINTSLPERADPLWKIEACLKEIKVQMPLLCDEVLLAQAEMGLSDGKCASVDKDLETMMMSLKVAAACTKAFHSKATKIIEAEDGLIVPLTGGGGKGDDDCVDC